MSREYDIKDILTEAGRRDLQSLPYTEWTPSEKHKKFEQNLKENQSCGKVREANTNPIKTRDTDIAGRGRGRTGSHLTHTSTS